MEIVHMEEENLYIFQTTWDISMKFLGKMWLTINDNIKKTRKNRVQTFHRKYIFGKTTKEGESQIKPPTILGLTPGVH